MIRTLGAACFALLPTLALAAGGEHGHGGHAEPHFDTPLFTAQAVNVLIIFVGLVYFLRKPVREFFAQKRQAYLAAAEQTLAAKKLAETELANVKADLARVENTAAESIARAKTEAEALRKSLHADAEALALRVKKDAETAAAAEVEKAKAALRSEVIQSSVSAAQAAMQKGVSQEDHLRLNKEFISNIKAVEQ